LEQKADGFAGFGLEVLPILQALDDTPRMGEDHDGSQDQFRRRPWINCLEFPGLDPISQDQLDDVAQRVLVGPNVIPVVLDRDQHDIVDALLGEQIFLVVGQDLKDQPLDALAWRGFGARNRSGSFFDL